MSPTVDALVQYGWSDRVATLYEEVAGPGHLPGRVVRVERASRLGRAACVVRLEVGEVTAVADVRPAVGDWVIVDQSAEGTHVVEHLLPRWSKLARQDPGNENGEQVLAANLDYVAIFAPLDRLKVGRIERELLIAWDSGASPLVLLTKADLVGDAEAIADDVRARLVGAEVVVTSSADGTGVHHVSELLQPNRTAVLFGPSGAGKSTLANALLGREALATGAVRETDQRGRHTTTTRHLLALPQGGVLIDTPGLRALPIWEGEQGLAAAFSDIEELARSCRFRDCGHEREPGCSVTAAVAAGDLDPERMASYRKLQLEVEHAERNRDLQARQAEASRVKALNKAMRNHPKKR